MSGKIERNLKAVEAGIGALLMVLTMLATLQGSLPEPLAAFVTVTIGALTTFRVWLARNADLITEAVEQVEELVTGTVGAYQKRD